LSLENGGNAPFIVFDDCDLDVALKALMNAKFRNAGQTCIAANRIFVHNNVYRKFAAMLTEAVAALKYGDGFGNGIAVGPLINKAGLDKVILN
jgi:succinate-semialdehyde dehydrogenase/glutarate-semialdehyde dehydrogenase